MPALNVSKAFTLIEPGPVVLVATHDRPEEEDSRQAPIGGLASYWL